MLELVDQPLTLNVKKVIRKIKKDCRTTIGDVTESTDISHTSVHKILRLNLEEKKVCSKLVLKVLMWNRRKNESSLKKHICTIAT